MLTRFRKNALLALASVAILTVAQPAHLRAQDAPAPAAEKAAPKSKTLWDALKDGGMIMVPIGLVSVGMCSLIVLGFLTLRKKKLVPDEHVQKLRELFMSGDYQNAVEYCRANPGFFTLDHQHPVLALLVLGLLHVQLQRQCQRRLPRGQGRLAGACAQQQGSAQQHQARDKVTLAHVASRAQSCEIIFSRRRASLTNGLRSSQA